MENIVTYQLEEYEGPLDLLLTLIQKNKINITDLPIALLCDQYLAAISEMEQMDMDLFIFPLKLCGDIPILRANSAKLMFDLTHKTLICSDILIFILRTIIVHLIL